MPPEGQAKTAFKVASAASAEADDAPQLRPIAPAPTGCKWTDVVVQREITVKGGYHKKALTVETREITGEDGEIDSFVNISKNDDWLLKTSGGPTARRGGTKRTRCIEEIKKVGRHLRFSRESRSRGRRAVQRPNGEVG